MDATFPKPIPGPDLARLRKTQGIEQAALAKRLDIHRVTLSAWERSAAVSPIRAARYQRALRDILEESIEATA